MCTAGLMCVAGDEIMYKKWDYIYRVLLKMEMVGRVQVTPFRILIDIQRGIVVFVSN